VGKGKSAFAPFPKRHPQNARRDPNLKEEAYVLGAVGAETQAHSMIFLGQVRHGKGYF
jgi:hypothetical protein